MLGIMLLVQSVVLNIEMREFKIDKIDMMSSQTQRQQFIDKY